MVGFHTRTSGPAPLEANSLPSGDQATELTAFVRASPSTMPVCVSGSSDTRSVSHTSTRRLSKPEANALPSGDQATDLTSSSLRRVCNSSPVVGFHNRTVKSLEPEANISPLGDQATDLT